MCWRVQTERYGLKTSTAELERFLHQTRDSVNIELARWGELAAREIATPVGDAVAYSLASPGKRLRPALVLGAFRELGGGDGDDAAEIAAAVEIVHTYSLVHDDLPCMDDDDIRRGRPTTHRKFDVATATEAGFRMLPLSARVLASGAAKLALSPQRLGAMGVELYRAAGATGMIRGQVLDLEAEGRDIPLDELIDLHRAKTGALITASTVIGAIAAGATDSQIEVIRNFGEEIGLAFQIVDDVLDATGTSAQLGKTAGKDARQKKASFVSALGVEEARATAHGHMMHAVDRLGRLDVDCTLLAELARYVVERKA